MNVIRLTTALIGAYMLIQSSRADGATWRPITLQELSLIKSTRDASADAEALFREVRVLNEAATFGYPQTVISEYVRLKIFTDRGKKYGSVEIPYSGRNVISGVAGRTIRPDGTIVELGKDAIFDKVVVKGNGRKVKVRSFAMPAVEPGVVIEYRWTRYVGEFISRYVPLDVQSEFPTDEVVFHIKPVSSQYVSWPTMRYLPFHCNVLKGNADIEGFSVLSVRDVPAFHEEPMMPPEYSIKQWVLIYYEENSKSRETEYWKEYGHELYREYSQRLKVNSDVKQIATTAVGDAKTDEEKVANLVAYCRKNLHDLNGQDVPTQQRDASKANRTSADTLKQGIGTPDDINYAFAALATAAGFEARLARLSDRALFMFDPAMPSGYFLNSYDIAVKVNGEWKFYDVTDHSLPPGVLSWHEEGVPALIVDGKDSKFVNTPLLTSDQSKVAKFGTLKLSAEGDLEGDLHIIYSGNKATEQRQQFQFMNEAEREEEVRSELKQRFASFELSRVKLNGVDDLSKAVGISYHVKIDGYAQRTGKRLFLNPAYYEAGVGTFFTGDKRELPIYFQYPWSETDYVTIQLPEGYQLDHADAPAAVKFDPVGSYSVKMFIDNKTTLRYERRLVFGTNQVPLFAKEAYPAIRQIFDRIHTADNHMLTLKSDGSQATTALHQ